jgi:hypothetical protein
MLLWIVNVVFPGAGLFWRKQIIQGSCYALAFGTLSAFRHEIGALWAIYVLIMAQVHFHKLRSGGEVREFGTTGKTIIWLVGALLLVLYSLMYGPSWTHNGEIKHPLLLFVLATVSIASPALLLTFWLRSKRRLAADTLNV